MKILYEYCAIFCWNLYCSKCLYILLEDLLDLSRKFSLQTKKIEYFSPEIVSALENKELINHFKVFRKSATSAHMDGRIIADIPLYTGQFSRMQFIPENAFEISNEKYLKSLP